MKCIPVKIFPIKLSPLRFTCFYNYWRAKARLGIIYNPFFQLYYKAFT